MTDQDLSVLRDAYGRDWYIRIINSEARATRRGDLSEEEMAAGLDMTIFDGDGGPLADLLAKQTRIENELIEAALA